MERDDEKLWVGGSNGVLTWKSMYHSQRGLVGKDIITCDKLQVIELSRTTLTQMSSFCAKTIHTHTRLDSVTQQGHTFLYSPRYLDTEMPLI